MRVAELACQAGVSADTVRHYTRAGLLRPRRNATNGYRNFDHADLVRLRFIRSARALGFSVDEIKTILACADHGDSPCAGVRRLAARHLEEVRTRLEDLRAVERRLSEALELWRELPDASPDGEHVCHLIESWANGSHEPS